MNNKHKAEMYPYAYIYHKKKTILIWQANGIDSFKKISDSSLLQSHTLSNMKTKLKSDAAKVHWAEYSEIDFDKFWAVLRNLRVDRASSIKTCSVLLSGWNFIEDVGRTFNLKPHMKRLRSKLLNKAYKKVFYGSNLPSVTPEAKLYNPVWTKNEIIAIRSELRAAWLALRKQGHIQQ